ncbi:MAG: hypothetical protein COT73_05520 [Bdellovibrio sp. CG10_big_fil_rev_8_21_14_0_10_47_8]|nr:MAG: hypothetical protein COT73_05520 [Bdellovibrio sp. CG10_big_fil_rev_8_21_14_0_10_47_8]
MSKELSTVEQLRSELDQWLLDSKNLWRTLDPIQATKRGNVKPYPKMWVKFHHQQKVYGLRDDTVLEAVHCFLELCEIYGSAAAALKVESTKNGTETLRLKTDAFAVGGWYCYQLK